MELTQKEIEALTTIISFESNIPKKEWAMYVPEVEGSVPLAGWTWSQVGINPGVLNSLLAKRLVKRTYESNKTKAYQTVDLEQLKQIAEGHATISPHLDERAEQESMVVLPPTMFEHIVGYEDLKDLFRGIMQLDKPIHVLLYGPPAISKTLFLYEIERAVGSQSMWLMGSGTSRNGMWDELAERRPKYILIDELEKMTYEGMTGLLSLMEKGRIVRTKVGRSMDIQLNAWVIASANRIDKIPVELKSRFAIKRLEEYTNTEYVHVVSRVLVTYEGCDEDTAHTIALKLFGKTHDVRDAIRVARLAHTLGVDKAVKLLMG